MSTVTVSLLTWNSISTIKQALDVSFHNTGRKWDELVWVDNGSEPDQLAVMKEVMAEYEPMTKIFYPKNTGMQRGFNTCLSIPRTDYVLPFCPDIPMMDDWLSIFMEYVEKIPNTGVATMYDVPISTAPERYRGSGEVEMINGLRILRAMPMGLFIVKRALLKWLGYFREDFGLYGWGDVEWAYRVERILPEIGQQFYVIPDHIIGHLGCPAAYPFDESRLESREYWEWKQKEMKLMQNDQVMSSARETNWPFYSPY